MLEGTRRKKCKHLFDGSRIPCERTATFLNISPIHIFNNGFINNGSIFCSMCNFARKESVSFDKDVFSGGFFLYIYLSLLFLKT